MQLDFSNCPRCLIPWSKINHDIFPGYIYCANKCGLIAFRNRYSGEPSKIVDIDLPLTKNSFVRWFSNGQVLVSFLQQYFTIDQIPFDITPERLEKLLSFI